MNVKIGDMLWVKIKGASSDYGYGEVTEVFTNNEDEVCFNFHCLINGGLRMGLEKKIINKPTERMTNKLFQNRAEIKKIMREKR
jgi:hypothetical protein